MRLLIFTAAVGGLLMLLAAGLEACLDGKLTEQRPSGTAVQFPD
jgi:hypothetical protein